VTGVVISNDFGRQREVYPSPSDPMAVARQLLDEYVLDNVLTLRQWRGGWMRWRGSHWAEIEPTVVRADIYRRLEHAVYIVVVKGSPEEREWQPNRHKVTDVLDALTAITHLPETVDTPSWLDDGPDSRRVGEPDSRRVGELVSCANGLLHVRTRNLIEHNPSTSTGSPSRSTSTRTRPSRGGGCNSSKSCGPTMRTPSPPSKSSSGTCCRVAPTCTRSCC